MGSKEVSKLFQVGSRRFGRSWRRRKEGWIIKPAARNPERTSPFAFLVDLLIYVSAMFLVREIYFPQVGFIANGLFWSLTTLVIATWRMRARGVSWQDLGLRRPRNCKSALLAAVAILGCAVISIVAFQILKDQLSIGMTPDNSNETAVFRFGDLSGNWGLFLAILPFVWLESALEELLDRGFLISWLEGLLSNTSFATIAAVIVQAVIFGFRHSYDLSERSITVGLIGLAMGIGYVALGRNLWPLVLAHCALNTMSMLDRVI